MGGVLSNIFLAVFFGSILSLAGGCLLLLKPGRPFAARPQGLIAFAAGVLLAVSFLDLLPEAEGAFPAALAGMTTLFLLEKVLCWYHQHHAPHNLIAPAVYFLTLGDSIHNFIDGVGIAAAFLVNPALGWATAAAVFLHELPHELVDFSILLSHGVSKKWTLALNFFSALTALLGAALTCYFAHLLTDQLALLLAFTAGAFIYVAAADLLPELSEEKPTPAVTLRQILAFLAGISAMLFLQGLRLG
jgi:zinc and cadmium transporter